MKKELQDYVWQNCLPKEFKEEVKKMWQSADKEQQLPHDAFLRGEYSILVSLFGHHNLTSDAEGEVMLYAKRSDVIKEFGKLHKYSYQSSDLQLGLNAFRNLFGSKCLPDEDTKPAEPEEPTCTDDCPSQCPSHLRNLSQETANCDKCPKSVKKTHPDFGHSRLHIAAMALQGILANSHQQMVEMNVERVVDLAILTADTLIAECDRTDKLKGE